mgnify:CR=1 FL=1|jgi:hypothetical protein
MADKNEANAATGGGEAAPAKADGAGSRLVWDDSQMTSSYANAVNVVSTQEEVMLFFGTNQTWDASQGERKVSVQLSDRIILNPLAAKRLATMLNGVLQQYEERFGKLTIR